MIQKFTLSIVALALTVGAYAFLSSGCSSANQADTKLIAQIAVQYGVGKVLENNPSYAQRVADIAGEVSKAAGGESSTVAAVMELARSKIDWTKLSPADRTLVNTLLLTIQSELTRRIQDGVLSPEKALLVQEVAGWIEAAAKLYVEEPPSAPGALGLAAPGCPIAGDTTSAG